MTTSPKITSADFSESTALEVLRFYMSPEAKPMSFTFSRDKDCLIIVSPECSVREQNLLAKCLSALGAIEIVCGSDGTTVDSATPVAQKLKAEGIKFAGDKDVPPLVIAKGGKKIRYNFDTQAKANTTANQIYLTLHHNENFGLDCINHHGQDHQQYNIYLEGRTKAGAIGNFVYNNTEKPPYIELDSGTSRHKTTLEKIVAEAAQAHGGTLAKVIEK